VIGMSRDIAILGGLGLMYLAMFATILKVGWFLVKERRMQDPDATSFHPASAANQAPENELSPAVRPTIPSPGIGHRAWNRRHLF